MKYRIYSLNGFPVTDDASYVKYLTPDNLIGEIDSKGEKITDDELKMWVHDFLGLKLFHWTFAHDRNVFTACDDNHSLYYYGIARVDKSDLTIGDYASMRNNMMNLVLKGYTTV